MSFSMVGFLKGETAEGTYILPGKKESSIELNISKQETADTTYQLAIKLINEVDWTLTVNDKPLITSEGREVSYSGITKISVNPFCEGILKVEAIYAEGMDCVWVDLSKEHYTVNEKSPITNIDELVAEAKLFKPEDGKTVEKIYSHPFLGVILCARSDDEVDIYLCKKNQEIIKTDSKKTAQSRNAQGGAKWEVKLPGKAKVHNFSFAWSKEFKPIWDHLRLNEASL